MQYNQKTFETHFKTCPLTSIILYTNDIIVSLTTLSTTDIQLIKYFNDLATRMQNKWKTIYCLKFAWMYSFVHFFIHLNADYMKFTQ